MGGCPEGSLEPFEQRVFGALGVFLADAGSGRGIEGVGNPTNNRHPQTKDFGWLI